MVPRQVWEGINETVHLKAGKATVSLQVHRDTDEQCAKTVRPTPPRPTAPWCTMPRCASLL